MNQQSHSRPDDDDEDDEDVSPSGTRLPNYITPPGLQALQDELRALLRVERPRVVEIVSWAAGNGDRSENGDYLYGKKRLREIDRRIRFLNRRIDCAVVVDPQTQKNRDRVFFGATVTYANSRDQECTITIVGVDEADFDKGRVSWHAPVARALMKAQEGDVVELRSPAGRESLEVLSICYASERKE